MSRPSFSQSQYFIFAFLISLQGSISASATDAVAPAQVFVRESAVMTKNGKPIADSSAELVRTDPFSAKNSAEKYHFRAAFSDGTSQLHSRSHRTVGPADNPKEIVLQEDVASEVTYAPPPKILKPGQTVTLKASWATEATVTCSKITQAKPARFTAMMYEMVGERKEGISQTNLKGKGVSFSREEKVKACKSRSKISKQASGTDDLILTPSAQRPVDKIVIRIEGAGPFGILYSYAAKSADEVELAAAPAPAVDAAGPEPVGGCDYGTEIVDIEKEAEQLARRGQIYKRFIQLKLPELPVLDFCLASSGNRISLQLKDPDDYFQKLTEFTGNLQEAFGLLGNSTAMLERAVQSKPVVDGLVGKTFGKMGEQFVSTFRFITSAGDDFSSVTSTALNKVRDGVLSTKASENPEEIVGFINDTVSMLPTVLEARKRMICTVKTGVPEFYTDVDALKKKSETLKAKIKDDATCRSSDGKHLQAKRLASLVDLKLRPVNAAHKWLANGIIKTSDDQTSFWESRHSWVDAKQTAGNRSQILAETQCP